MNIPLDLNAEYIDIQYRIWKKDPGQVPRQWDLFFTGFDLALSLDQEVLGICDKQQVLKQSRVDELIYRYRDLGHLLACLDPLESCPVDHPLLTLDAFGLKTEDLDQVFYTPQISLWEQATLRDILHLMKETYCRCVGVEYMHLQDPDERRWLQERMESVRNRPSFDAAIRLRILQKLCTATLFEQFLHSKYIGQKRFSIEGAEAIIAMLDALLDHAAQMDYSEVILAMAHRGRLNVQVNVLNRPYEAVFCSFEENYNPEALVGSGDVKYHLGYMAEIQTRTGKPLTVLMPSNASHLESVDPVAEGIARRRQEEWESNGAERVLPILIHGDAAFSGQGVVFETLNLSQLEGYCTGGTIHIVINNQIGFTTLPQDIRSTRYSTDVAKMLMVPIFHVHGEDPEAVVHAVHLACDYRSQFAKDVVIDVVCYRRYGHNEGDEPAYTQPQMYDRIRQRPPVYQIYVQDCIDAGIISDTEMEAFEKEFSQRLESAFDNSRRLTCRPPDITFYNMWDNFDLEYIHKPVETAVGEDLIKELARIIFEIPEGFSVNRKLKRILQRRIEAVEKGDSIDWATAELLAFGTLLRDGFSVRLSGQDCRRGTFSQRHSVIIDTRTGEHYTPLKTVAEKDNRTSFDVYDSMLSEFAVLGFEYGYSLAAPNSLVLWEAQFGDFANNAQVIIDQYLSSAEAKWQRKSGLVLLLPHGFEGQGPEHSSARLERFLQLCADDNLQICMPSTPAQYFHLLRRQMLRTFRKPLVIMTPKSLLRHARAVSQLDEFTSGRFHEIMDDPEPPSSPRRILFCSGKIYYDLLSKREAHRKHHVAIVRIEQLYPFARDQLENVVSRYGTEAEWIWVQEEPSNMGAWMYIKGVFEELELSLSGCISRPASASPAAGLLRVHKQEQEDIVRRALGLENSPTE